MTSYSTYTLYFNPSTWEKLRQQLALLNTPEPQPVTPHLPLWVQENTPTLTLDENPRVSGTAKWSAQNLIGQSPGSLTAGTSIETLWDTVVADEHLQAWPKFDQHHQTTWVALAAAFGFDFIAVDVSEFEVTLWHCQGGLEPSQWHYDLPEKPSADSHEDEVELAHRWEADKGYMVHTVYKLVESHVNEHGLANIEALDAEITNNF